MGYYKMNFEAFNNLVKELTSFLQSQCVNLVLPQVKIRKIVAIVIYRLVHGTSATHMADLFNVKASTVKKYVDIVCDALCDKNKLFSRYISISCNDHIQKIIDHFHDLINMLNICGAIDGTHISSASFPHKRVTLVANDFLIRKKIIAL